MRSIPYAVYILTNRRRTVLYTGVTNNLARRIVEHRRSSRLSFARRYNAHILVYVEWSGQIGPAIAREKQIRAGSRAGKVALSEAMNREWKDLAPLFGIESPEGAGSSDRT